MEGSTVNLRKGPLALVWVPQALKLVEHAVNEPMLTSWGRLIDPSFYLH